MPNPYKHWIAAAGCSLALASSPLWAAAPIANELQVEAVVFGESAVLSAIATDPDADLLRIVFSVSGPGVSGWHTIGSINVSGSGSGAEAIWTPPQTGTYTAKIDVYDRGVGTASLTRAFEVYVGRYELRNTTLESGQNRYIGYDGEIRTKENLGGNEVWVKNGGGMILWSAGRIVLKPGFRADTGSFFWAAIDADKDGYSDVADMADHDGDGIADAWELDHGFTIGVNDASGDADSDGISNLQEFLARSDPRRKDNPNIGLEIFTPNL